MSEGCKTCGYRGGPDLGHIEHAHKVCLELGKMLAAQSEKHKATIAILSGQKKNAMLIGLSNEVTRLRRELEQAQRALQASTREIRKSLGLEDRP